MSAQGCRQAHHALERLIGFLEVSVLSSHGMDNADSPSVCIGCCSAEALRRLPEDSCWGVIESCVEAVLACVAQCTTYALRLSFRSLRPHLYYAVMVL